MYNTNQLANIEAEIQKEIDSIIDKYTPIINETINAQIKPTDTLIEGMGTALVLNQKGEYIAERFADYVARYQYGDVFRTAIDITDIDRRINKPA